MTQEEKVNTFLVAMEAGLPATIEELVPLSFLGQAAVDFYRAKTKALKALDVADEQRKATLRDGQDAGDMLLEIEARIGELLDNAPTHDTAKAGGPGQPPPALRRPDGITHRRSTGARAIARHPEAVEAIKREARQDEDIPTKTAVLNRIKLQKQMERNANPQRQDKPDINRVAIAVANQLGDCVAKLTRMWPEHAAINAEVCRSICESVDALRQIVKEECRA